MVDKQVLYRQIIDNLTTDLNVAMQAASSAHAAAVNAETQPDNKYDTLSLESSYIAQGYANRAQQIRKSLQAYNDLVLRVFTDDDPILLSALVEIEFDTGDRRTIFIAPAAGGMKIRCADTVVVNVITPESPLARALLGQRTGDSFAVGTVNDQHGEIISLW
ncbi:MAG: GreA/GreB family elongation factor [Desulfuromonas sp.]|nr:GreA/GreB family elongation factor [Desulfuromonas sp.]